MPGYEIRNEERVASATIRGFLSQVLLCVHRWIDLDEGSVLIVEGNEDIDVHALADGVLNSASEESVKDLAGRLTARSEAVYETLANFVEAFAYHHSAGVQVRLSFTTTAGRGNQQTNSALAVPALTFDLLLAWELLLRDEPEVPAETIFSGVAAVISAKLGGNRDSAHNVALRYVLERGLEEAFLRSVTWNFEAEDADTLRARLLERLTERCRGNISRARVLCERLVGLVWQAASSSSLAARTLNRAMVVKIEEEVAQTHRAWQNWERMAALSSWLSWRADHYSVVGVQSLDPLWSCIVVGVNFLPDQDEHVLAKVIMAAAEDPAIEPRAREHLSRFDLKEAFWEDEVVRVRMLDAFRNTAIQLYVFLSREPLTQELLEQALRVRQQRKDRDAIDFSGNAEVLRLLPLPKFVERRAHVATIEVLALAIARWQLGGEPVAARTIRWIAPWVKLLRTVDGSFHDQESQIWAGAR